MSKLPRISGKNLIKTLKNFGFETTKVKGSHHILKHKDGRMTVVPVHSKEIIGPGLLSKILSDCEINKEEFTRLF
jgi:predicted RNA binding protein YcfA (HicA-like mRNA interferase family)